MAEQRASDLISLPSGGGAIAGIGQTFQADAQTGTGNLRIPLPLPPGRPGLDPALQLEYSTGNGNGPFGRGWALSVPEVRRRTSKGVPRYDDAQDVFVLSGAEELVPVEGGAGGMQYRPRTEAAWARIVHVTDGGDHWDVWSKEGHRSRYGTQDADIREPSGGIYAWLLSETVDLCGNTIRYRYEADAPGAPQRLLSEVLYADHGDRADPGFLVRVRIVYADRPDPFTDRRPGFALRTTRRAERIEVWTGPGDGALATSVELGYADEDGDAPATGASLLSRVTIVGWDGDDSQRMPPLELGYTTWDPGRRSLRALRGELPATALEPGLDLVDLYGDGLPSIVELAGTCRYWRNRGRGEFAAPRPFAEAPAGATLRTPGTRFADMDGNGRPDLLLAGSGRTEVWPLAFPEADGGREPAAAFDPTRARVAREALPVDLSDPRARLVDLDGDGRMDLVRADDRAYGAYAQPDGGFGPLEPLERTDAPWTSIEDPRLRFADMTGDGLSDLVLLHDGAVTYWPGLGRGRWDEPVVMDDAPRFEDGASYDTTGFDPRRLLLGDLTGDGTADLAYVGDGHVTVWVNQSGNAFAAPVVIPGTPAVDDATAVRLADVLGQGMSGVLWTANATRPLRYAFMDLAGGVKPHLLERIDNHMGSQTTIEYAPSTVFAESDAAAGRPWQTTLPFPVHVVARVTVSETFTGSSLASEYAYHDGYWDGTDREFRGFGRVDQRDVPSTFAPPRVATRPARASAVGTPVGPPDRLPDVVVNGSFTAARPDPGPYVVAGPGARGDAAADGWAAENPEVEASETRTELVPGGLRVRCTAQGCSVRQALFDAGRGPSRARVTVALEVIRGTVAIATGDGARSEAVGEPSSSGVVRSVTRVNPVSEVSLVADASGGAEFTVRSVTVEPLETGNLLENARFDEPSGTGPTTLAGPSRGGPSAAAGWTVWNNPDATTTTELRPTTRSGGAGQMLQVSTSGDGCGLVQTFLTYGAGPARTRAAAWVRVTRGAVAIGTGNGGNTGRDGTVTAADGWQLLEAANGVAPANELIIYAADAAGADFTVDAAWLRELDDPPGPVEVAPPTESRTWFHLGPVGPDRGAWRELDRDADHWPGDPALLAGRVDARTSDELSREERREAVRAMKGRVLRTELYALDGDDRADRPVAVTEYDHEVVLVARAAPGAATPAVFASRERGQRTTQWERGDDPKTKASFTGDFDEYGRARSTVEAGVPRGRDARAAAAGQDPLLATLTRVDYATRDDADRYVLDRVAATRRFELRDPGDGTLSGFRDAVEAGTLPPPRPLAADFRFYDGAPFTGLAWGVLGDHALVSRGEQLAVTRGQLETVGADPHYLWPGEDGALLAEWFRDAGLSERALRRPERGIALPAGAVDPVLGAPGSVRWSGELLPEATGLHTFTVAAAGGARLWIAGQLLADAWDDASVEASADVELVADAPAELRLEYRVPPSNGRIELRWSAPGRAAEPLPADRLRMPASAAPAPDTALPEGFRDRLPALAGYRYRTATEDDGAPYVDGYYVATGRRYDVHADTAGRGLLTAERDAFGHDTSVGYDEYELLADTLTGRGADPMTRRAAYDYRVFKPAQITDENGNRTACGYTPLGLLRDVSLMGRAGEEQGDTASEPGVVHAYDLTAWDESGPAARRPVSVETTRRVEHRWTLVADENARRAAQGQPPLDDDGIAALFPPGERELFPERFTRLREFSDGLGRKLQARAQWTPMRFGPEGPDDDAGLPIDRSEPAGAVIRRDAEPGEPYVVVSGWQIRDTKGRVVHDHEPFLSSGYDYDAPAAAIDRRRTTTRLDALGRPVRVIGPDGSERLVVRGVPGTIADPDLRFPDLFEPTPWETYTYDANDNAGRTHPLHSGAYADHWNTAANATVDALDRVVGSVERNGPAAADEHVTTTAYDVAGNALSVTDPLGRVVATSAYDAMGRAWSTELIDAGRIARVLDAGGIAVDSLDEKGARTLTALDVLRRRTRIWARDADGRPLTLRTRVVYGDDAQDAGLSREAALAANLLTRPYLTLDEAGALTALACELQGNVVESRRRLVRVELIVAELDRGGPDYERRSLVVDWEPAPGESLQDREDALLSAEAHETSARYDALGHCTLRRLPAAGDATRRELRTDYDPGGRAIRIRLGDLTVVERIAYDAAGRRLLVLYGNGVMTRLAYEPASGRLRRLRSEPFRATGAGYEPTGAAALQDLAQHVDLAGNPLLIADRTPGCGTGPTPDALDRRFTHDPRYRLTSATGRECAVEPPTPWDASPRCADPAATRPYSETYGCDAAGNLLQIRRPGSPGGGRDFPLVSGSNRLAARETSAGRTEYAFDATGNVLGEGPERRLEWDHANRLVTFRTQAGAGPPSVHCAYRYDAGGQRVLKLVRKGAGRLEVTTYLDEAMTVRSVLSGGASEANAEIVVATGPGSPLAELRIGAPLQGDTSPALRFHLADQLGSCAVTLDGQGTLVTREEYLPYGETSFGGLGAKRYRFAGTERDEHSGLGCHGMRYYAPWLGRWTSCDPAGLADGPSPYAYVRGRPMASVDPTGLQGTPAENLTCSAPAAGDQSRPRSSTAAAQPGASRPPPAASSPTTPKGRAAEEEDQRAPQTASSVRVFVQYTIRPVSTEGTVANGTLQLWSNVGEAKAVAAVKADPYRNWMMGDIQGSPTPQHLDALVDEAVAEFVEASGGKPYTRVEFEEIWGPASAKVVGRASAAGMPVESNGVVTPTNIQGKFELPAVRTWGVVGGGLSVGTGMYSAISGGQSKDPGVAIPSVVFGVTETTGGIMYAAGAYGGSALAMTIGAGVATVGAGGGAIVMGVALLPGDIKRGDTPAVVADGAAIVGGGLLIASLVVGVAAAPVVLVVGVGLVAFAAGFRIARWLRE